MSREELGTAPVDGPGPHASQRPGDGTPAGPPGRAVAGRASPPPWQPRSRRTTAAGLVLTALASAVVGWGGARWWATTSDAAAPAGEAATAVVVDATTAADTRGRPTLELTVLLTSRDVVPLTLTGPGDAPGGGPALAGRIVAVDAEDAQLPPGGTLTTTVRAVADCASPRPLHLPGLQLRRSGRSPVQVPLVGGGRALVGACTAQSTGPPVVELVGTAPDGDRLRVRVRSPSGRPTEVTAVLAGSVRLTGAPLPTTVDAHGRDLWLEPPRPCPREWVDGGLPRSVELDVVAGQGAGQDAGRGAGRGGSADADDGQVVLDTGFALPRWLRAGACAEAAP